MITVDGLPFQGEPAEDLAVEACPGCGAMPGDGVSEYCEDEAGCGYLKALELAFKLSDAEYGEE